MTLINWTFLFLNCGHISMHSFFFFCFITYPMSAHYFLLFCSTNLQWRSARRWHYFWGLCTFTTQRWRNGSVESCCHVSSLSPPPSKHLTSSSFVLAIVVVFFFVLWKKICTHKIKLAQKSTTISSE